MSAPLSFPRRHARRIAAVAIAGGLCAASRLPSLEAGERAELARPFAFQTVELPTAGPVPARTIRPVHPDFERIRGWISAVGGAVALHDLDGDGLPNDACWVDTRSDRVVVAPVPGTGARYADFALHPGAALLDAATMAPMGCLPGDLDEDGRADLLVYYWGRTPLAFLRRDPSPVPAADAYRVMDVAPGGGRWFSNAGLLADVDGDGHADLVIGNYFPDGARVLDARGGGREQMQRSMSRAFNGGRDRVLLWAGAAPGAEPSVRFREAAGALPERAADGWTLALAAADLDGDLLPELYVANDFGPDRLLHNRSRPGAVRFVQAEGRRTIGTPRSRVLGRDSFKGMGADFGDLDGDGVLDLVVSNIASEYALEESHFAFLGTGDGAALARGRAPFVDRSEQLGLSRGGWGWDARIADLDNDGAAEVLRATGFLRGDTRRWAELQELAMGNDALLHHPQSWPRFHAGDELNGHDADGFLVRHPSGRFFDVGAEAGAGDTRVTRGIAPADVDGDGRLDFAVGAQWAPSTVYLNRAPAAGAFLGIHLLLPVGDADGSTRILRGHPSPETRARPALGAQATVHLPDGSTRIALVDGGNGHSGKRSPDIHLGLGTHPPDTPLRVTLRWRDGAGRPRSREVSLLPGWSTVVLGGGR
jgi:hypothetical protein